MGGMAVQKYLESQVAPAAVLLASAPPSGLVRATLRVASRHPLVFMRANLKMSPFPIVSTVELAREALFSRGMPEERVQRYLSRLEDESYRAYLDMIGLRLPRPRRLRTPLLVLGGADDRLISPSEVAVTSYIGTFEEERASREKFGIEYVKYGERVPLVDFVMGIVRLLRRKWLG